MPGEQLSYGGKPISDLSRQALGIPTLRDYQADAIETIAQRKGFITLRLPTGAGKTVIVLFNPVLNAIRASGGQQRSSAAKHLITIVLVPLRSLQGNHATKILCNNILQRYVEFLTIEGDEDIRTARERLGKWKFSTPTRSTLIFLNPEALQELQSSFCAVRNHMGWIVIDEGHVFPFWIDFRSAFSALRDLAHRFYRSTLIAASATLTLDTESKLRELLNVPVEQCTDIVHLYRRENLHYNFMKEQDVLRNIRELFGADRGPMLIIVKSLKDIPFLLQNVPRWTGGQATVRTELYAAGFSDGHKDLVEAWFEKDEPGVWKILIATVAYGLGIDVGHIRSVIVWGVPQTLAALIQGFGRAGRNQTLVPIAHCTLVVTPNSLKKADEDVRALLGLRRTAKDESKGKKKADAASDADCSTSVLCEDCLTWRVLGTGESVPGPNEPFNCTRIGKKCKPLGLIRPNVCVSVALERFMSRSDSPLDAPMGDTDVACVNRCSFCQPLPPIQIPVVGDFVIVVSRSSQFYGLAGKVVQVVDETKLKINFGAQNSAVTVTCTSVEKSSKMDHVIPETISLPSHSHEKEALGEALDRAVETSGSRLHIKLLMSDSARALLLKWRPTTVEELNRLQGLFIPSRMQERLVRTIQLHQETNRRNKRVKAASKPKVSKRKADEAARPPFVSTSQRTSTRSGRQVRHQDWSQMGDEEDDE